ncbi:MAG: DMT family transporter, partial [Myxococcota bacterium]
VVLKSQVVLTPIVSVWALGERASGRFWSGALVALAGVALPALIASDEGHSPLGYGLAFVAAVGFCGMQIVTRRVIHRIEPARVNAIRLVMAIGALQLLEEGRAAWSLNSQTWAYAAAAGVLGPGLSRLCLMTAVRYLSPSVIALVALIGPIFAFALGALFFGEAPSEWELLGAGLILLGIVWPFGASFRTKSDD